MAPIRGMRNMLMELRKICQHPYLSQPDLEDPTQPVDKQREQLVNASGKLYFLKILLPKLKARGHRVLLFSQFKIALDRIEDFLQLEGYAFRRIDGDTPQAQRQKDIDAYNAPGSDVFIFLLTTRAGGVGINLATADTVIVYDPDFNPHMDLQAIARAHRFGQQKKVLVFKLMVKQSVEEKIMQAGKKKMVLDHLVVQNMGNEEDVDVNSMLLHGARAILEDDNQNDALYTSDNVDELINRVEADAEAQVATEGEPQAKEAMAFDFAKVWEVANGFTELVEQEAEAEEESHAFWANVTRNAEAARKKQEADRNSRRAKTKAPVYYSPASPPAKKKKSKSEAVASEEDDDFQPGQLESEDEQIPEVMPEELRELLAREKVPSKAPYKKVKAAVHFLPFDRNDPAQQHQYAICDWAVKGMSKTLVEYNCSPLLSLFRYAGRADLAVGDRKAACDALGAEVNRVLSTNGESIGPEILRQAFDFMISRGMDFKLFDREDKTRVVDNAEDNAAKEKKRRIKDRQDALRMIRLHEVVARQLKASRLAEAQQASTPQVRLQESESTLLQCRLTLDNNRRQKGESEAETRAQQEQRERKAQTRKARHAQRIRDWQTGVQIEDPQARLARIVAMAHAQEEAQAKSARHKAAAREAFCDAKCGSASVRACVEGRGGRPILKQRIRQLDQCLAQPRVVDRDGFMATARKVLLDVYKQWPRE